MSELLTAKTENDMVDTDTKSSVKIESMIKKTDFFSAGGRDLLLIRLKATGGNFMRISTSTNIHEIYGQDPYYFTIEESMQLCAKAGFQVVDINFHSASLPGGPLDCPEWESWIENIGKLKEELHLDISQGHAHFYVFPAEEEELRWHEKMIERSIHAAGRLGVRWLVVHPYSLEDAAWYSHRKSIEANLHYMKRYEKIAEPYKNLGLAIENMVENRDKRRFGSSAEDLIELHTALDSERFGLCWDFGHAERSQINQCAALRQMGKRLKATHIEDTNGLYFGCDHLVPFAGDVDWANIMKTLKEIGYEGDAVFEIHNFTRRMPIELREDVVRFCYRLGSYLVSMAEHA